MDKAIVQSDVHLKKSRSKGKKKYGPIFTVLPVTLWMFILVAVPLIIVVAMGFLTRGSYGQIEYKFTLDNYKTLAQGIYLKIMLYSLWISFLATAICLVLAYPFAYFIAKASSKHKIILFMLIMLPFWTNSLVRTYAWIVILRTTGVLNSYLMKFGLIHNPIQMLYTTGSVLVGLVYTLFPFMVLPLYTSIDSLDKSYIEAASDLGATPIQTFTNIILPLTMPGISAGCLLVFIPALGLFFIPDLLGGSKVMMVSNLIQNQFLTARNWPFGSAMSIFLIGITVLFIIVYFKKANRKSEVL
ncbi:MULTISPECIES: ABC transporter permease [Clostridium]|uniref:ABC transporter permease n=1 Tax=Clostridium TaxID=1485 RepID=UPI000826BC91|nr:MULTISPECIES: ABC transporter permease [Clostridium]PJI06899.1 ABC transporter permease [Clostridium sp. CT7]